MVEDLRFEFVGFVRKQLGFLLRQRTKHAGVTLISVSGCKPANNAES